MAPRNPQAPRTPARRPPPASTPGGFRLLSKLGSLKGLPDLQLHLPRLPDFSDLIAAEKPAVVIQLAPCVEDIVALSGLSPDLPATIEATIREQVREAFPQGDVVSVSLGDAPDHALLLKDPNTLTPEEAQRLPAERSKLLARRQNYGIYLEAPRAGSNLPRRKGTQESDQGLDILPLIEGRGAPFGLAIDLPLVQKAANARLAAEQPRFTFDGDSCACGPLLPTHVSMRVIQPGSIVETVVSVIVTVLPEAIQPEAELRIREKLSVTGGAAAETGTLDDDVEASVKVTKITKLDLPDRAEKLLEGDFFQKLLGNLLFIPAMLALGIQAIGSAVLTKRLREGADLPGPVGAALSALLAQQLVPGTGDPTNQEESPGQKLVFDLDRLDLNEAASRIQAKGVVLNADRAQRAQIARIARARRAGTGFDVTFAAAATDLAAPVTFTWTCPLGTLVGENGRASVKFHVEGAALANLQVSVDATDAEGFHDSDAAVFSQVNVGTISVLVRVT